MAPRTVLALIGPLMLSGFQLAAQQPQQRLPIRPLPPDIVPPDVFRQRDALQVDPSHYQLEFENDRVRVLRLTLKPNEAVPVHDAEDAVVVCLKECHLRLERPGGHSETVHLEAGRDRWIFGDFRTEKNLGSEAVEILFIEPKSAKTSGKPPV